MFLCVAEKPDFEPRVIAIDPDDETIERIVRGLLWDDLTFVSLRADEHHLLEGIGTGKQEDGFSVRCVVRDQEYVANTTLDSLSRIVEVLQSYRAGNEHWTRVVEWDDDLWKDVTQGRGRKSGYSILIRLEPGELDNPDLDIRYTLPDLIAQRSQGLVWPDGYDFAKEDQESGPALVLFLWAEELKPALDCVISVIQNDRVLGNDLRKGTVVAVATLQGDRVVYPVNCPRRIVR
jgi:hypothetical protein